MIDLMTDEAAYLEMVLTVPVIRIRTEIHGLCVSYTHEPELTYSLSFIGLVQVPKGYEGSVSYSGKNYFLLCNKLCVDSDGHETTSTRVAKFKPDMRVEYEMNLSNFDMILGEPDAVYRFDNMGFGWVTAEKV